MSISGLMIWHNIDFMFIDMPPGTGDVPLPVFQSIKVDGIIIDDEYTNQRVG